MPNTSRAVDALPTAEHAEIRAAHNAGMTLVAYRAMQKSEPVSRTRVGTQKPRSNPVSLGTLPIDESRAAGPVSIVLPWSTLLTDNNRQAWVGTRMMTTKEYKLAKQRAVEAIENQIGDSLPGWLLASGWQPLFVEPVALRVVLIEPNRTSKRDLLNYQKLICDAMKGVVYADDSLIDDAHFRRGIPDIDRPRAEITVRPL